jgi:demethylmenaquinone methyltransferase/2-methoxy-6-polyprenyl-1,4-benzoquinol methylase
MTQEMVQYYAERAAEYDKIYDIPPWRNGISTLQQRLPAFFAGRRVYEVACGTGYWTQYIAQQARRVYATDINDTPLVLARCRTYGQAQVTFQQADAYTAPAVPETFDAGCAGFWLSHVDLGRMHDFLTAFHMRLERGARVLMFDERLSPRRRLPTSRVDRRGNRYEERQLANGARFEIIKNFYTPQQFQDLFGDNGDNLSYEELDHFWVFSYRRK